MENRLKLFNTALSCLSKDMAPQEDDFGCMEALNAVFKKAFGQEIGGGLSTYRAYLILRKDARFEKTLIPLAGDIVISPTGYGNGKLRNGHAGIVGEKEKIMSNTSANGLWQENYTLTTWKRKFKDYGGFPMDYFRVVTPPAPVPVTPLTPRQKQSILNLLIAFVADSTIIERIKSIFGISPVFGGVPRSSQWPKVRGEFLLKNPNCAVCGRKSSLFKPLNVHHKILYSIDPSLELEKSNLITLCREDHFSWGHLYSWSSWNKNVEEEARHWRDKVVSRP